MSQDIQQDINTPSAFDKIRSAYAEAASNLLDRAGIAWDAINGKELTPEQMQAIGLVQQTANTPSVGSTLMDQGSAIYNALTNPELYAKGLKYLKDSSLEQIASDTASAIATLPADILNFTTKGLVNAGISGSSDKYASADPLGNAAALVGMVPGVGNAVGKATQTALGMPLKLANKATLGVVPKIGKGLYEASPTVVKSAIDAGGNAATKALEAYGTALDAATNPVGATLKAASKPIDHVTDKLGTAITEKQVLNSPLTQTAKELGLIPEGATAKEVKSIINSPEVKETYAKVKQAREAIKSSKYKKSDLGKSALTAEEINANNVDAILSNFESKGLVPSRDTSFSTKLLQNDKNIPTTAFEDLSETAKRKVTQDYLKGRAVDSTTDLTAPVSKSDVAQWHNKNIMDAHIEANPSKYGDVYKAGSQARQELDVLQDIIVKDGKRLSPKEAIDAHRNWSATKTFDKGNFSEDFKQFLSENNIAGADIPDWQTLSRLHTDFKDWQAARKTPKGTGVDPSTNTAASKVLHDRRMKRGEADSKAGKDTPDAKYYKQRTKPMDPVWERAAKTEAVKKGYMKAGESLSSLTDSQFTEVSSTAEGALKASSAAKARIQSQTEALRTQYSSDLYDDLVGNSKPATAKQVKDLELKLKTAVDDNTKALQDYITTALQGSNIQVAKNDLNAIIKSIAKDNGTSFEELVHTPNLADKLTNKTISLDVSEKSIGSFPEDVRRKMADEAFLKATSGKKGKNLDKNALRLLKERIGKQFNIEGYR